LRWFLTRWLPALIASLFLVYFSAISIFASQLFFLSQDLNRIRSVYEVNGITSEFQKLIDDSLPKITKLRSNMEMPLVTSLIELSGKKSEINLAIEFSDYLLPILPVISKIAGAETPKRYLVALQNPAEARGTGGILGAYAIIRLDKGLIKVEQVASNLLLQHQSEIPVKLPGEFSNTYGSDPAIWMNSNMSPHFPYGARIWLGLWEKQFSDRLDGVITLDPIVLSHIMKVTGPMTVEGGRIDSQNIVDQTLSQAYFRFEHDNLARKEFLVEIISGVAERLFSPGVDYRKLMWALTKPIIENRILFYSAEPKVQSFVKHSAISGVLTSQSNNEYRLVIQNTAGNKMDFYLDRELSIASKSCGTNKVTHVSFRVINSVTKQQYLPAYVKGRLDIDLPSGQENSTALTAFLYGPPGANLIYALNKSSGLSAGYIKRERNREALVVPLELTAGESAAFEMEFKGGSGPLSAYVQPLVKTQSTQVQDECLR
jgi:hypothetical protein